MIMYLYSYELDDDVEFVCIHVEMESFRVTIVCFWNGSIRSSNSNVHYDDVLIANKSNKKD